MRRWNSPEGIAFEDVQTGDGRIYVAGSFYWDDQPNGWALRADLEDDGWHAGAVLVGAVDSIARGDGGRITGTGWLDDETDNGAAVARMLDNGAPLGVSVDLDDLEVEMVATGVEEDEDGMVVLASSFARGRITFGADGDIQRVEIPGLRRALVAAGVTAAAGDGEPDDGVVVWTDSMDAMIMRVTRARIRGLTLVDIPAFHRAAIVLDTVSAAPDPAPETDDAEAARAAAVTVHDPVPCDTCGQVPADAIAAAAILDTFVAPTRPPRSWFDDPNFGDDDVTTVEDPETGRTLRGVPMQYLASGQVLGHIALWNQCHSGSPDGSCVLTPRSASGYTWFHHGHLLTEEGDLLPVGNLTIGGGHADIRLSYRAALAHYDDVSTQTAQLRAGEDRYGVWVAGAGLPDRWSDDLEMRKLRAASPSGDWRWIGGSLELVHTHCVNSPGFGVPRAQVAAGGRVMSLVAAGAREIALLNAADPAHAAGLAVGEIGAMVEAAVARGIAAHEAEQTRQAGLARLDAAARPVALRRFR